MTNSGEIYTVSRTLNFLQESYEVSSYPPQKHVSGFGRIKSRTAR